MQSGVGTYHGHRFCAAWAVRPYLVKRASRLLLVSRVAAGAPRAARLGSPWAPWAEAVATIFLHFGCCWAVSCVLVRFRPLVSPSMFTSSTSCCCRHPCPCLCLSSLLHPVSVCLSVCVYVCVCLCVCVCGRLVGMSALLRFVCVLSYPEFRA